MEVMVYTFLNWNNITYKLARELGRRGTRVKYIRSSRDVEKLADLVVTEKYDYVLGLGDYRKDAKRIRIESKFANRYGRNEICEGGAEEYLSNWSLSGSSETYLGNGVSNGPCNRSAYLIARSIGEGKMKTKIAFVHIPRKFSFEGALSVLHGWIDHLG